MAFVNNQNKGLNHRGHTGPANCSFDSVVFNHEEPSETVNNAAPVVGVYFVSVIVYCVICYALDLFCNFPLSSILIILIISYIPCGHLEPCFNVVQFLYGLIFYWRATSLSEF